MNQNIKLSFGLALLLAPLLALLLAGCGSTPPEVVQNSEAVQNAASQEAPLAAATGNGLNAEYFDRPNFTNSRLKRSEQTVNFNWGNGSPAPTTIAPNTFSARYSGELSAPTSGSYTFYVTADDGVRLNLAGQRVVNDFADHPARTATGTVNLTAGVRLPLKLEYYENTGLASLKLEWSGPNLARQVIPASALFTGAAVNPAPVNPVPTGKTFYVAPGGNDGGPGSEAQPWATLGWAAKTLNPGETVLVKDGTYPGVYVTRSGTAGKPITFRAAPGAKPNIVITEINSPGFLLEGASYIDIQGFSLDYRVPGVENANGKRWEGGITIKSNDYGAARVYAHHVNVIGNSVHGFPGGGIGSGQADYIRIEGNTIWETALWSEYDTSAVSLYQSRDADLAPGFHNVIRANTVFKNENKVPGTGIGSTTITDGNCIIIDDGRNTQRFQDDKAVYPPYKSATLIENNICADNGGRGVNVFSSDNVLVRHNTFYHNGRTPNLDSEISVLAASNVRVVNNIIVPRPGQRATSVYGGDVAEFKVSNVVFANNLYFGSDKLPQRGASDLVADPLFVSPSLDLNTANFRLKPGSPATDKALKSDTPATDVGGLPRPVGAGPDIGAWEAR
jgi:parallel beta-helix repeat protein